MTVSKWLFIFVAAGFILAENVVAADDKLTKEDLINRIIIGGTTESEAKWHTVEIDGCTITTFVYAPYENEEPWPLYSSFIFDLSVVRVLELGGVGKYYVMVDDIVPGHQNPHGAMILFRTISPHTALHEVPNHRKPKKPVRVSSRKGADGYVFTESTAFMILNEGLANNSLPKLFTESLLEYQKRYCPIP